jgi:hypothetical protein
MLDRRGYVDAMETTTYYATIGASRTFADFRTRYGFVGDEGDAPALFDRVTFSRRDVQLVGKPHVTQSN